MRYTEARLTAAAMEMVASIDEDTVDFIPNYDGSEQQPDVLPGPHRLDSCAWVGARLADLLPLPLHAKQELLELSDPVTRLERLNALLRSGARAES